MSEKNMDVEHLIIRRAAPDDLVPLEMSCNEFVRLIPGFQEGFLEGNFVVFLAESDGVVMGAVAGTDRQRKPADGDMAILPAFKLFFLNVNQAFSGRGVGRALFERLIEYLREKKFGVVSISLFQNYTRGIHFFERFGFQKKSVHRGLIELELNLWESFGVVEEEPFDEL
ncbi:MAG: GNAT family N-acetyltransferase [Promethearchaeota archaeon]